MSEQDQDLEPDGRSPQGRAASAVELAGLVAEERYARQRLDLYRAKTYGGRATSTARMQELERRLTSARARLAAARRLGGLSRTVR